MVKVLVDRKSLLNEIMRIEDQINSMKRDPTYLRIKSNLINLEERRFGRSKIFISSPDNQEIVLELKCNSEEMRDILLRYRERQKDFDLKMDELYIEKVRLQEQLFKK